MLIVAWPEREHLLSFTINQINKTDICPGRFLKFIPPPRIQFLEFFFCVTSAKVGPRLPLSGFSFHIIRHTHTSGRTPLHEWSACRTGHYIHDTQRTHEMNMHALSGPRTRDSNNWAAADLRLIAHDHKFYT